MVKYDGKEIRDTEGFMIRENMTAYQYHQALQRVHSGELYRVRPGVFAETSALADTMLDMCRAAFFAPTPHGSITNLQLKFLPPIASPFPASGKSSSPTFRQYRCTIGQIIC